MYNYTGAKKRGIQYEKDAQEFLKSTYGNAIYPNTWFIFDELRRGEIHKRWCQVDCIHANQETKELIIFEMKLHHSPRAWWQLHTLYYPVVRFAFGEGWNYKVVEMTRIHDPEIRYPTPIYLTRKLEFKNFPTTNIFIWRGN